MKNNGQIISKLFRKSVVSIILAAIATMLGIVIDGIVIGRFLGKDSMAAYGLVTPVINLATAFSGILATGAQIICAQRLGAGKKEKARQAFSMCMIITVCVAVLMMAVVLIFRDDISVARRKRQFGAFEGADLRLSARLGVLVPLSFVFV